MPRLHTHHLLWFAAWLAVVAAIVVPLYMMRLRMVERLSRPEATAEWRTWRAATERQREASGPVERRAAAGDEPPSLVLLRDHFAAIVATSVLMGSFLFAFLAFVARGISRERANAKPGQRNHSPGEPSP